MESITVSPNKIANIRRTLVNNSVPPTVSRTPADYDSDEDDDEERLQLKRRYEAEKPQPPAAVKQRKRIIIVRTKADGTQYRY